MIPNNPQMEQQPLFCYETMLKLLYWSCLVYDHDRVCCCEAMCCVGRGGKAERRVGGGQSSLLTIQTSCFVRVACSTVMPGYKSLQSACAFASQRLAACLVDSGLTMSECLSSVLNMTEPLHVSQLFVHLQGNHRAKQSQASPVTDKPAPPVTSSAKTILTLETAMGL